MDESVNQVLIVGAGPVGAVCALALQQQGVAVRVIEAQPPDARADTRTLALSHGSQLILERLGVWHRLEGVTPITRIHISQRGALGVTRLSAGEAKVPALGYVLPYATLAAALKQALHDAAIAVDYGVAVARIAPGEQVASLHTAAGEVLAAPLVVVADGGRSGHAQLADAAPAPRLARDYAQTAVVCEVQTELPHAHQAFERFTPEGPAALLPHAGTPTFYGLKPVKDRMPKSDRYALVWTAGNADAARIAALPDAEFLAALYRHFGGRQGLFLHASPRKTFPLRLAYAGSEAAGRVVRIGNAAQTLHPVSGQGFNIGLRDAWELASLAGDAAPGTLGDAAMLRTYARARRLDVLGGIGFTDFLVQVFSNDIAPIRHARGLGLLALEMCPPLKDFVARRMIFGARG